MKTDAKNQNNRQTVGRRKFIKGAIAAGGAAGLVASGDLGFNIRTAKAATKTWKIQTSWPGGIGLKIFKDWCNGIADKTGGELAFKPFGAKDVVGDFQLFDAVRNGVIEAMNPFTLYWAGRMPASVFFSSYPLGLRTEGEWDVFFYALGGREIARELFAKVGMFYVGHIHHGPNIIHSKVPIRSIEDFRGRKCACPAEWWPSCFRVPAPRRPCCPVGRSLPPWRRAPSMWRITWDRRLTMPWVSTR